MKLKLSLVDAERSRDVVVTTDVTATVGDVARYLVEADPLRDGTATAAAVTLRLWAPGSTRSRLVDPLLSVQESGIRSGCSVQVVAPDEQRVGDERYARPVALLEVVSGPDAGRTFRLPAGVSHVGRASTARIRLSDASVSRRHASITVESTATVVDLNSANGVEVDGRLVERSTLGPAAVLRIGDSELRLHMLVGPDAVDPRRIGARTDGAGAPSAQSPAPLAPPVPELDDDASVPVEQTLVRTGTVPGASDPPLVEPVAPGQAPGASGEVIRDAPPSVARSAPAEDVATDDGEVDALDAIRRPFVRSPRVEPAYPGETVQLPELPSIPERARFPVLAVIAPVIMGAVLFAVTRQVFSLLFIALSPLIMIGTYVDNRIQNRRRGRDERARFAESMADAHERLEAERDVQRAARVAESPSVDEVVDAVRTRSALLWTRKPEHATFLEVRFGLGTQASRTTVQLPGHHSAGPAWWAEVKDLEREFATVDGVPVLEDLERAGSLGVAGDSTLARDAARSLVVQLVGLHSPADLVVTAFASEAGRDEWDWLTWLPHVDSPHSPLGVSGLAGDHSSATMLLAELEELIATRRAAGEGRGEQVRSHLEGSASADAAHGRAVDALPAVPAVLAVVASDVQADRGRLVALAEQGPDYGVFVLWLAADVTELPVACRTYLEVDGATGRATVGFVRSGTRVELEHLDSLDALRALETARLLAPVEDSGAPVLDESDLPHRVGFLDLFEGGIADDPRAVHQRWVKNDSLVAAWRPGVSRPPGGIRALVGQGPAEPFALDLRRHGPHALVGGTTGSGKSEFLQTWIMGIATEYAPDRVTFLLVDYKGGAAFAECVDLPHTVGLVTDLDTRLVRRALTSLRAELTHREHLLNAKGAKDLETLEKRGDADAPPSLVIVIDEFAALAKEVPEFVDGVIDVAQRGRSLGLHLVMATQRPAGVIKDNLRANTNLRVALRVADEADSQDVLGVPTAAFFSPGAPGRAAAKLGPGRVLDLQTAYLGGWTTDADDQRVDVEVTELRFGEGRDWVVRSRDASIDEGAPRDIERLAGTIVRAARDAGLRTPRRPWVEPLPDVLDLTDLPPASGSVLPLGLRDEPERQRRTAWTLDLDRAGNVAVIGTGGSGRTTLLRTVAVVASASATKDPVWIHALDFAGGGLGSLESLPTVGSVIDGDDDERVTRLFSDLAALVDERSARFATARASTLGEFRASTGEALPRVLLLLDGMTAFRTEYEFRSGGAVFDRFSALLSAGRQVGVHVVVTADRLGTFSTSLQANLQSRVVLRLASEAEYAVTGVAPDMLSGAPAGRAVVDGHEVQVAVAGGTSDAAAQAAVVDALGAELSPAVPQAPGVRRLPEHVPASSLPAVLGDDRLPVLGLADDTLAPVPLPLEGLFVVTGPFGSGRSTTTTTVARGISTARPTWDAFLVATRRSRQDGAVAWISAASTPEEADALATELATRLETASSGDDPGLFVVVDGVGDLEGLPADGSVARMLKAARRAGAVVVVETDTVTGAGAWQTYSELKTARAGIVLQPEEGDGLTIFRTQFPRVTRRDFPVGRGLLVRAGRTTKVQVAVPDRP